MTPGITASRNVGVSAPANIEFVGAKTYKFSSGSPTFNFAGLTGGIGQAQNGDYFLAWITEVASTAGVAGYTAPPGGLGNIHNQRLDDSRDNASRLDHGFINDAATDGGQWHTSLTRTRLGVLLVFRGVNPTTPLDVASVPYGALSTRIPNLPPITPATNGSKIIAIGSGSGPIGPNNYADPADGSSVLIKDNYEHSTVGRAIFMAVSKAWSTGDGAFDPEPWGGFTNGTDGAAIGVTLAMRPV